MRIYFKNSVIRTCLFLFLSVILISEFCCRWSSSSILAIDKIDYSFPVFV